MPTCCCHHKHDPCLVAEFLTQDDDPSYPTFFADVDPFVYDSQTDRGGVQVISGSCYIDSSIQVLRNSTGGGGPSDFTLLVNRDPRAPDNPFKRIFVKFNQPSNPLGLVVRLIFNANSDASAYNYVEYQWTGGTPPIATVTVGSTRAGTASATTTISDGDQMTDETLYFEGCYEPSGLLTGTFYHASPASGGVGYGASVVIAPAGLLPSGGSSFPDCGLLVIAGGVACRFWDLWCFNSDKDCPKCRPGVRVGCDNCINDKYPPEFLITLAGTDGFDFDGGYILDSGSPPYFSGDFYPGGAAEAFYGCRYSIHVDLNPQRQRRVGAFITVPPAFAYYNLEFIDIVVSIEGVLTGDPLVQNHPGLYEIAARITWDLGDALNVSGSNSYRFFAYFSLDQAGPIDCLNLSSLSLPFQFWNSDVGFPPITYGTPANFQAAMAAMSVNLTSLNL